jgi:hypothetical protein
MLKWRLIVFNHGVFRYYLFPVHVYYILNQGVFQVKLKFLLLFIKLANACKN